MWSGKRTALHVLDVIAATLPPEDPTVTVQYRKHTEPDEPRLACLRNPNGDIYRAEHLRDIGERGLRRLYERDKLTSDELDRLLAELRALD